MSSLGWGIDPYGTGPYGGVTAASGMSIANAVAISTHEVQVTLTQEPMHAQGTNVGDALNPATWDVQRLADGALFHVLDARIGDSNHIFILTLFEPLGPATVQHRVSSSTLLDVGGAGIVPPTSADFAGLIAAAVATPTAQTVQRGASVQDLANPQPVVQGGTLRIGTSGDYESETGVALLRKLILRRIMTAPGDFFHLPNYGVGIRQKQPLVTTDLVQLKATIESQARAEPEVDDVSCSLLQSADGSLQIQLRVRSKNTGQQFSVGTTVPASGTIAL